MSAITASDAPAQGKRVRRERTTGGPNLATGLSPEAKRMAAAILEVLAGARTPTEAAQTLGVSVPRYYQVETRALTGLLAACESKPRGRQPNPANEANVLRQENQRLQREITRHQSLTRAAQRAVGLAPPSPTPSGKTGKKTRKRRMARALNVARRLQADSPTDVTPPASSTSPNG